MTVSPTALGPSPSKPAGGPCTDPRCMVATDDASWRTVTIPHDFVVEGNFSKTFDGEAAVGSTISKETGLQVSMAEKVSMSTTDPKVHGYLPFGIGWCELRLQLQLLLWLRLMLRLTSTQHISCTAYKLYISTSSYVP